MEGNLRLSVGLIVLALILSVLSGCEKQAVLDPDRAAITDRCIDLFTRLKVNDRTVIYENEFPYVRDQMDLQEFLSMPRIAAYKSDTLNALQIDSVNVWKDTAYLYLQMEYVHADSSLSIKPLKLRWYKQDSTWIKPSGSTLEKQKEVEEEIRIYWEAVREKQAQEQQKSGKDSQ